MTNTTENQRGIRLQRLELFNWGTFDKKVWSIEPNGGASLLTGANGSGKSTVVDALLTLLVSNKSRNYNQASGSGGKRERTELSYVRGAYGKVQQEGEYTAKAQYLREKGGYSVLLAVFGNKETSITAAQFFWMQDKLNKFYVVADTALSITADFSNVRDIRSLKRGLRQQDGVQVFDQFQQYNKAFRKRVTLGSKALDLFNQTVTIKEIGSLNEFVRRHMLETPPTRDKVDGLIENFENLTRAYNAMERARDQLNLLRPLIHNADRHHNFRQEIAHLEQCEQALPIYFAGHKHKLLQTEITTAVRELTQLEQQQTTEQEGINQLQERVTALNISIEGDNVGRQLQAINTEIKHLNQQKNQTRKQAREYDALAKTFNLPSLTTADSFYDARKKAETEFGQTIQRWLDQQRKDEREAQIEENQLEQTRQELQVEIDSLNQRRSQIPEQNLRVRNQILDALSIAEADVPFIGELLRVRESEKLWEGAIERLLHNFGLRLLVPERHYNRVVDYVRKNHLNGRVVFHKIPENTPNPLVDNIDPDMLFHKISIKPDTLFRAWLETELSKQYRYTCCETDKEFKRSKRAITPEGLIKSGNERHEKDDRRRINDRRNFILGWNNKDKIRALEDELSQVISKLAQTKKRLHKATRQRDEAIKKEQRLQNLLAFDDFSQLDWHSLAQQIETLEAERTRLTNSSDQLQQLREELTAVRQTIKEKQETLREHSNNIGRWQSLKEGWQKELIACERTLEQADHEQMQTYAPDIAKHHSKLTLATLSHAQDKARSHFTDTLRRRTNRLNEVDRELTRAIGVYKNQYPAETADVDNDISSIPTFRTMLKQVEHDDLPQYEARFKSLMTEKMAQYVTILQAELDKYEEEVQESIADLNKALRLIDYTDNTYIQLQTNPNRDPEIRTFRNDLRACLPDVGNPDLQSSYLRVKGLIDRFKTETRWTAKVTDVRQWLDFSAVEKFRADDTQKNYYTDSSGKSGGQKAKLAYTILASAIAYQYGINGRAHLNKTFRFVVVDEAFSRSDEVNSRYAMDLFQTLGLQLLVVTPLTGTHIVEPYVAACHFINNNRDGNDSQIHNMSINRFQKEREQWQGRVTSDEPPRQSSIANLKS